MFGILKRNGRVYAKVIADVSGATLVPLIKKKVVVDSIVYSDTWKAYNALDIEGFRHRRINHSEVYVDPTDKKNHINGIENFLGLNAVKRSWQKETYENIMASQENPLNCF